MTDPKDVLAAERTLLAWIRTGIALMGFGFVVSRFGLFLRELARIAGKSDPHPLDSALSGVMVVAAGVAVNVWASLRYRRLVQRLREGDREIGGTGPLVMGVSTGIGGAILILVLLQSLLR